MVQPIFEARGYEVFQVSAAAHMGLQELTYAMARIIQEERRQKAKEVKTRIVLRPVAVNDNGFKVVANEDRSFTITGEKPERFVRQTDFGNTEAVGYLADRLAALGVEKELFKQGAKPGSEVRIGLGDAAVIFDWEPSIEAGAELLAGPRGGDRRIESPWAGRFMEDDVDELSEDEISRQRKTLVSTGDRSAKIRTYNWPQGRVTDHRIGLTSYNLDAVINGEIEEFIEALQMAENSEKMANQQ